MDSTTPDGRTSSAQTISAPAAEMLFAGEGEMRARCRAFDWAATPLGPVETWPRSLATTAATVLGAGFPSVLLWGPALIQIYNDAYVPIIGAKHPRALGHGNAETWPEVWHINGPIYERVRRGETVTAKDALYPLARTGRDDRPEEVYLTISYSPVLDDAGSIGGVFVSLFDTTAQVAARRLEEERARLEADVRRAEHRAARLLDQVSDAHITMDADFRIFAVNPAAERMLGKSRGEILGRTHWEAFPASVGSEAERRYRRVQRERVEEHFSHHYVGEGYDVHLEIDAYPVEHDGVAVFWRDVTARVRDELTLRDMNAALEFRNAQLADQALELELTTAQLQENAAQLETTNDELQSTARALEERTAESEAAVAALRTSEARLRDIFAQAPVAIAVMTGPEHVYTVVSPRYAETPGRGRPLVGRTVREAFPEIAAQGFADVIDRVYTTGEPYFAPERRVLLEIPGGATEEHFFNIGYQPLRDDDGRVYGIASVAHDVTDHVVARHDRERLVRELEVERARLADVFRRAPSFLAVLRGPEHVFQLVNDAYYQLVGHRELIGRPVLDALPELRDQGYKELLDRVLHTGEPFVGREFPAMLARTPGAPPEERFVDLTYLPLVDVDGVRAGVIAHGTDVTEQVMARRDIERLLGESERARAEAEQARAEADAANRAKSEFLATMSHEIRTPINAIQGYAQLLDLGLGGAVTPQQRDYLSRLATSSQHLLGLINDVLDLSKVEAGELNVARDSAATGTAIAAALDLVGPQAAGRGVRLVDAERGAAGVAYVGDEHRVRQVLVNLLSNAVKFTEPGGTVTVTTGTAAGVPPEARVDGGGGPWAFVRVEDTGVGIARELHAAIFDPFVQAESGHTRTKGGTGLGLAISRRLARLMGGDLTLESEVGRGSAFTLWLPAADRVQTGWTAEMTAAQTRTARASALAARSLGELGTILRGETDAVLGAYVERLRGDAGTPLARAMSAGALEDHAVTLLADLAQSLVIAGEAGADAINLLRDGSAIQRAIAEHHGARRHAQGWTLAAVRRDYQLLLEELERAVRARVATPEDAERVELADALRMLVGFVERAAQSSARTWRRLDEAEGDARAGANGGGSGPPPATRREE